jgi:hypothetical protein
VREKDGIERSAPRQNLVSALLLGVSAHFCTGK